MTAQPASGGHATDTVTRVLVTGAQGQVGRELATLAWPSGYEVTALDRNGLDITDEEAVRGRVSDLGPALIINAAAYTAVDEAEDQPDRAAAVNHQGVSHLAEAAGANGARLIHLSTDYVFDGTSDGWYTEDDPTSPLGVYGATKRAGELAALDQPGSVVVRTAWVYSSHGHNFVKTMRRLATERPSLGVVADQEGCPTSARDLARGLITLAGRLRDNQAFNDPRVVHLAAPDSATWFDLACEVFRLGGRGDIEVTPLTTAEYPTRAARPANSKLDSSLAQRQWGLMLAPWRTALAEVCAELDRLEPTAHPAPSSHPAQSKQPEDSQ